MNKILVFALLGGMLCLPFIDTTSDESTGYIVIAWNDLGMHCNGNDFSTIAILPPANNLRAQVIKVGSESDDPEIITQGVRVTYEVPGNTYSAGKTNFWDFAERLYGTKLDDNIGLNGFGMSGDMVAEDNYFKADGIPITAFTDDDLDNENPYQLALVKVFDLEGNLLAMSQPVIPVSGEIGCVSSGCHSSQQSILNHHEDEDGFNPNDTPVMCGKCHESISLPGAGNAEAKSLSYRIHKEHAEKTDNCYSCHPGHNAKCLRGVHSQNLSCQSCHGTLSEMANSIRNGRIPWEEEPSCGQSGCHNSKYAPNHGKLFKDSKGHEGIYCNACHGSPHAILPSKESNDNLQNIALQGYIGVLRECSVCHGITPDKNGPHGIAPVGIEEEEDRKLILKPNPAYDIIKIDNSIPGERILIVDLRGEILDLKPIGNVNNTFDISNLSPGVYFVQVGNRTLKFVKK